MMSTKLQQQRMMTKNPLSNFSTPYQQYKKQLECNLQLIKNLFPLEETSKIKALLEELENNKDTVIDILQEEALKVSAICQEKHIQSRKKLTLCQENKLLKQSYLRLYQRLMKREKELEEAQGKLQRCLRENERYKMQNKFLMEKEYSETKDINNLHIY